MPRVALACGHTGGHLIPARLVAEALTGRNVETVLYSTASSDHWLLESFPGEFTPTRIEGWSGRSPMAKLRTLGLCLHDFAVLKNSVGTLDGVIGFGGYSSIPVLIAAWTQGVPVFLQEQNRVTGKANRLFVQAARRFFCGFPPMEDVLPIMPRVIGNPVRRMQPSSDPWTRTNRLLVVVGGSQGARELSKHLDTTAEPLLKRGWSIYYVKGSFGRDYRDRSWSCEDRFRQVEFTPDLPSIMARAHCVWTRGGAGSLSELLHYGNPAVIFPLPGAADDHQRWNARWVTERGPAAMIERGIGGKELVNLTVALARREPGYSVPWSTEKPPEQTIAREVVECI